RFHLWQLSRCNSNQASKSQGDGRRLPLLPRGDHLRNRRGLERRCLRALPFQRRTFGCLVCNCQSVKESFDGPRSKRFPEPLAPFFNRGVGGDCCGGNRRVVGEYLPTQGRDKERLLPGGGIE